MFGINAVFNTVWQCPGLVFVDNSLPKGLSDSGMGKNRGFFYPWQQRKWDQTLRFLPLTWESPFPCHIKKKRRMLPSLQGQLDKASSSFQSKSIRARKQVKNFRGTSNNNGNWMSRTLLSQYKLAAFVAYIYYSKTHYNFTKDWRPTHNCEKEVKKYSKTLFPSSHRSREVDKCLINFFINLHSRHFRWGENQTLCLTLS